VPAHDRGEALGSPKELAPRRPIPLDMRANTPTTRSLLSVLLACALFLGAGIASARQLFVPPEDEAVDCPVDDAGGEPADEGDGETDAVLLSLKVADDEGEIEECPPAEDEEVAPDDVTDDVGEDRDGGDVAVEPSGDRHADCDAAAGIVADEGEEAEQEAVEEKLTGPDNAIDHVVASCKKNTKAPGLLNALAHLVANRERHEAHDVWKAERAEARADSKAAKFESDHPGGNPHEDHPGNGDH